MNKNYDYVLQQNSYDCGIASLISILMYYGIRPSREKIIDSISKKHGGYTAYDLIKIGNMYGLEGYGLKTNIKELEKLPVIAHTIKDKNMFHFIVIYEIHNDYIKVLDPSEGIKNMSFEEFEEISTNIFLIFTGLKKKKLSNKLFRKELLKIVKANKYIIITTLFLSFIFILLSLVFSYYLKLVLTYSNSITIIYVISVIFLFVSIFKTLIYYIKNQLILKLSLKINVELTNRTTDHILNLPYEYFTKKTTGELITILEDVENFKEIITKIFVISASDLFLIIIVIIYTLILNFYIGIMLIAIMLILFIITRKYQYVFNDSFLRYRNSKINYTSKIINYITSFETIKNLNATKNILQILDKDYKKLNDENKMYSKKMYRYNFITSSIIDIFYIIIIFFTSYISIKESIDILDIVLFSSIFYMIIDFITNINESISLYKVYQTSIDRVLDLLEVNTEEFNDTNFSSINKITIKDLSYVKDDCIILDNINLEIFKGEKVFLTGKSGIGKSTLMRLILRYYSPSSGDILIDDISLSYFDLSFIRNRITYIGQNEQLWNGTIKSNLEIVCNDWSKIEEVSSITLLDKLFEKNNIDYNYIIEESGYNLSGGERKKLILARGLLKDSDVFILDEVFNEISVDEEREILKNIFSKYNDKMIIVISHRNKNQDLFNKKYQLKGGGVIDEIK